MNHLHCLWASLTGKRRPYITRLWKPRSLGHITESILWISIEQNGSRDPIRAWRFNLGPTYNGTVAGIFILTPWFSILGHIRTQAPTR